MRKIMAVLACWAWIPFCGQPLRGQPPGVGIVSGSHQKQQSKLTATQAKSDQQGTQDSPLVVDIKSRPKTPEEAAQEKRRIDDKKLVDTRTFRLAVVNTFFTGVLMLVGIGGVCLALRTLRVLEKQAKATKDSVDVLINSERAWVIVSRVGNPDTKYGWYAPDTPQYLPGMVFEFEVCGKTVARIMDARFDLLPVPARTRFAPSWEPLEPDLPPVPDYTRRKRSQEIAEDGQVVIPGQKFRIMVSLPQTLNVSEWESLRDEKTVMCAYGLIKYDSLGKHKETAVCYVYRFHWGGVFTSGDGTVLNPSSFELAGPPAYNRSI
jgi:hypothetical protein